MPEFSEQTYQNAITQVDSLKEKAIALFKLEYKNEKTYKDCVKATYSTVPNSKFEAIKGEITVKGTMNDLLEFDHSIKEIKPSDNNKAVYMKFAQLSDDLKKDILSNKSGSYLIYQCMDSKVPLVSKRDFTMLRTTFDISINGVQQILIVTASIECCEKFVEKAVRANIMSAVKYTQLEGNQILVESVCHVDPAGNVPAMIFNTMLDGQNNYLVKLGKQFK